MRCATRGALHNAENWNSNNTEGAHTVSAGTTVTLQKPFRTRIISAQTMNFLAICPHSSRLLIVRYFFPDLFNDFSSLFAVKNARSDMMKTSINCCFFAFLLAFIHISTSTKLRTCHTNPCRNGGTCYRTTSELMRITCTHFS